MEHEFLIYNGPGTDAENYTNCIKFVLEILHSINKIGRLVASGFNVGLELPNGLLAMVWELRLRVV